MTLTQDSSALPAHLDSAACLRQSGQAGCSGNEHVTPQQQQRPLSRLVQRQAYVNLSDDEADALPGVRTGTDVVAFYARFGPGSAVRFFNANRYHCPDMHGY